MASAGVVVVRRAYVLSELRSVETSPGDRPENPIVGAATLTAMVVAGAFWIGQPWFALGGPVVAALVYGFGGASRAERALRPAAFSFRPWGVMARVEQGGRSEWAPRRWAEIESYEHRRVEVKDDNGREIFSVVRMRIGGVSYVTKRDYEDVLDVLDAVRERYAHEATRPIALGWRGATEVLDPHSTGAFSRVLGAARAYLTSFTERGANEIELENREAILRALIERPTGAEHGCFAAVVAAELNFEGALEALLAMTLTPSPLLSAIARAAAQRLGAHPSRTFPVADVAPFLGAEEIAEIDAWSRGDGG
jgi:hypothetical protein